MNKFILRKFPWIKSNQRVQNSLNQYVNWISIIRDDHWDTCVYGWRTLIRKTTFWRKMKVYFIFLQIIIKMRFVKKIIIFGVNYWVPNKEYVQKKLIQIKTDFVCFLPGSIISFYRALKILCMVSIFSKLKVFIGNTPLTRHSLENKSKMTNNTLLPWKIKDISEME